LLNSLSEVQKNYDEIPKIYFYTKNNQKNIFLRYGEQIQQNLDNDRAYYEGLDFIESISMDSYVADPIRNIGDKSRINRCVTGVNIQVSEKSKINYSLLFDDIKIGKE
jgi:hypothetical protein